VRTVRQGEYLFKFDDGGVVEATVTDRHDKPDIPLIVEYVDGLEPSYSDTRFVDKTKFTLRDKDVKYAIWQSSRNILGLGSIDLRDELSIHGDSLDLLEFTMAVEGKTGVCVPDDLFNPDMTFGQFELIVTNAVKQQKTLR
jgi:acyl carrier protein